jgi:hypothetical protein
MLLLTLTVGQGPSIPPPTPSPGFPPAPPRAPLPLPLALPLSEDPLERGDFADLARALSLHEAGLGGPPLGASAGWEEEDLIRRLTGLTRATSADRVQDLRRKLRLYHPGALPLWTDPLHAAPGLIAALRAPPACEVRQPTCLLGSGTTAPRYRIRPKRHELTEEPKSQERTTSRSPPKHPSPPLKVTKRPVCLSALIRLRWRTCVPTPTTRGSWRARSMRWSTSSPTIARMTITATATSRRRPMPGGSWPGG